MQPSYWKLDTGSGTWDQDLIPNLAGLETVWGKWMRKLRIINVTLDLPRSPKASQQRQPFFFLRNDKEIKCPHSKVPCVSSWENYANIQKI